MFRITRLVFLIIIASSLFSETGLAQQRFKAGLIAGLNASQILRDDVGGYHRLGLRGGLRAITILTPKTDLFFEILYSQRGSYAKLGSPTTCFNGALEISANYIEIPVMYTFKDWLDEEEGFYKVQVSGGLSYGRLLSASSIGSCHDNVTDYFNKNDISITLGASFFVNEHLTFGARWSRSLNLLYNREKGPLIPIDPTVENSPMKPDPNNPNSLRGFFLSFQAGYIF